MMKFGCDVKEWSLETAQTNLYHFDKVLEGTSKGDFCVGDQVSMADIFLMSMILES